MSQPFASDLVPAQFFVLRTPLLPFRTISDSGDAGGAAAGVGRGTAEVNRDSLLQTVRRTDVQEAIRIASPGLAADIDLWIEDPDSKRGQAVERSLARYVSRMSTRSTPFGLFAACSVGQTATGTFLQLGRSSARHTRLDMSYLTALTEALEGRTAVRSHLTYRPNTSLYFSAGRWRYVRSCVEAAGRAFRLVAVEPADYLDETLIRARCGATIQQLAGPLASEAVSLREAEEYIEDLIDAQLLVGDLAPTLTGSDPLQQIIASLDLPPATRDLAAELRTVQLALVDLDDEGVGASCGAYERIQASLPQLAGQINPAHLLQVDLMRPAVHASLGPQVISDLRQAVEILRFVSGRKPFESLARFREDFVARYGSCEMPLTEVLDEEMGIGFGASSAPEAAAEPLLGGLRFPPPPGSALRWKARHDVLLKLLTEALASGEREIELLPETIRSMNAGDALPEFDTLAVIASLGAPSETAVAHGNYRIFVHSVVPAGARLFGRFCALDDELEAQVRGFVAAEEALRPGAVFAEITHLPEGRIGNVLLRPVLREYEIPYLSRSGAPQDRRLPITDLLVSIEGNRVVLRSASLQREVIPRLTAAHNFSDASLGIYRFLCSLETQATGGGLIWSWGPLAASHFLPRVVCGRLVLARARWLMPEEMVRGMRALPPHERYDAFQHWRSRHEVPRWVLLVEGDNELAIDLDSALALESAFHLLRPSASAEFVEMVPSPEELLVRGPDGLYMHEVVVPFVRRDAPPAQSRSAGLTAPPSQRSFLPGSEWLFVKMYTGTSTADVLLKELVNPFVRAVTDSGQVDHWFFLRYADPDWHLRLRMHGTKDGLISALAMLTDMIEPWRDRGLMWRFAIDTYEREVERYGGADGIILSEQLFHYDSEAALAIVDALAGDDGLHWRWQVALSGIDALLDDLSFALPERLELVRQASAGLRREFRFAAAHRKQMGSLFRRLRPATGDLLGAPLTDDPRLAQALEAIATRSVANAPVIDSLRSAASFGRLSLPIYELARSYVHMSVNRVLRSAHRAQELVLCELLDRTYVSRIARGL